MAISYVQLSLDTNYSEFSDFDCSYDGVPDYTKEEIRSLSEYLSREDGAKSDLKKGFGITTVAYKDGELAGYFTLMGGSIIEGSIGDEFLDRFPFYCTTYPALKISRFAVDKKYQSKKDKAGLKVSDYMLIEILSIGISLSRVEVESRYEDYLSRDEKSQYEERLERLGMRFVITDALGVKKTLMFYHNRGFKPFNNKRYETTFNDILAGTYKKPEDVKHVGIPMYLDLHNKFK